MLEAKLLKTDILPLIVNFLLFHCLKTFFIFGNFNLQLSSVIFCSSFLLKCMPSSTNSSVNSNFSFSKFIILPSPTVPSCTTLVFSIFTFRPETLWKNFRVSNTLFRLFLQFLVIRVVSSAYCYILCSYPKNLIPSILLFSLMAMPSISAHITKM